jgi:putative SOS response-associated peptidase YedK
MHRIPVVVVAYRCIVPAIGYYERQLEKDIKQPYFVHRLSDQVQITTLHGSQASRSTVPLDRAAWASPQRLIQI